MTVGGLKLLQRENAAKGFLLLIEGGRIDHVSCCASKKGKMWFLFQVNPFENCWNNFRQIMTAQRLGLCQRHWPWRGQFRYWRHFWQINNCSPSMQAVLEAVDMTETLVLVTADHSHTLSLGGYPGRGADITGVEIVPGLLSFLKLFFVFLVRLALLTLDGFSRLRMAKDCRFYRINWDILTFKL